MARETTLLARHPKVVSSFTKAAREHWPEYLMEAAELAAFMLSACVFVVLLEHPASPLRALLSSALLRRALIGVAMGATAIAIVYSPLGRRSGAHFNPCVTLTFFRLGKVSAPDATFYVIGHFVGGAVGVGIAAALLRGSLADPAVSFAVTVPGPAGTAAAFAAELSISFGLMTAVLAASNTRAAPLTGVIAGTLVAIYILVEAPFSGMSMNPARTFASAFFAGRWTALWLYFAAPAAGMLLAAEAYVRLRQRGEVHCAKLHHDDRVRCIFCGAAAAERTPRTHARRPQHATMRRSRCQTNATT